jgi:transcriptional regulator with XRE-family HTH domain
MTVGERLKIARLNLNMTQKELADKAYISVAYVNRIENGYRFNVSIPILKSIAEILHIDYMKLTQGELENTENVVIIKANKQDKTLADWTTEELIVELLKREREKQKPTSKKGV